MNNDAKPLPLQGIRVLEFTHAIMGPAAGLVLADLGADVIRIERTPEGDDTRRLKGFGTGYFTFYNRNKRSIVVDLKSAKGAQIVHELVKTADVLVENFAPHTMERLGFGYEAVTAENPRLIYCSLKGFMQGPYENRPALDEVVQMMSGLAYMTGPIGQPLRAGASVVDIMGGTFGAMAVLVALMQRQQTGRGQFVMNGLFETAAFIMGQHMAYSAIGQEPIPPMPARVAAWSVYRVFNTADGKQVFVGITSDKHWERFCSAFKRDDLLADATLATNNLRITHRDRLLPDLEAMMAKMDLCEIVANCELAEIPFSPIAHPEDLFDDPQLNQGGSLLPVTLADGRQTKLPRLPITMTDHDFNLRLEAPRIGEHSDDLLHELGYDADTIASLCDDGVVVLSE